MKLATLKLSHKNAGDFADGSFITPQNITETDLFSMRERNVLGISDEIENEACQVWEFAFWKPSDDKAKVIERTSVVPEVIPPARFKYEATIHQGRIERILETDRLRYSRSGRLIRTKYLIRADGAHSVVRRCMGLTLDGESLDHIWGVIDLVIDTDFPDIRRRCAIHSPAGSIMVIPRERILTGDYLTRLYVQVPGLVDQKGDLIDEEAFKVPRSGRDLRAKVTLEGILQQATNAFRPYSIRPKHHDSIDWWAAYQIVQRVSPKFIVKDSQRIDRVFIVGDACHTHSPKAGQGMNVSMMDSYNLAWKLAYHINGISPMIDNLAPLLDTYQVERQSNAQILIDFDRKFSAMFSGEMDIGAEHTYKEFRETFSTGNGFTSGCGVEYPESMVVVRDSPDNATSPVHGTNYLLGVLWPVTYGT
ncbi:Monooxygenase, FAD-binding [Penicillium occitanis (nom. inval.)]|nr:Monooxygenase, FAD-binding [Penicillium occitanis (nom. inval.)]PCG98147.1 hypothetical protein PENOC_064680 [Penicillium occitanis (nom. inval.)]